MITNRSDYRLVYGDLSYIDISGSLICPSPPVGYDFYGHFDGSTSASGGTRVVRGEDVCWLMESLRARTFCGSDPVSASNVWHFDRFSLHHASSSEVIHCEDGGGVLSSDREASRKFSIAGLQDIISLIGYFNDYMRPLQRDQALYPDSAGRQGPSVLSAGLSLDSGDSFLCGAKPSLFWPRNGVSTPCVVAQISSPARPEEVCARLSAMEYYMPFTRWIVHNAQETAVEIVYDDGASTYSGNMEVHWANPVFTESVTPVYHGSISGKTLNQNVGGYFVIIPAGKTYQPDDSGAVHLDVTGDVLDSAKSLHHVRDVKYCAVTNIELIHTLNDRYALYE